MALGGETVTTTVEGRERYSVNLRYPRALRSDPQSIAGQVLVPTANGGMVPLGQVASIQLSQGPVSIRTENADRKSVVSGKRVAVRVDHGGRRIIKKTTKK